MKYVNPHYSKVKKIFTMIVSCNQCKTDLFKYHKIGKGALKRLWIDRTEAGAVDLTEPPQDLLCPRCGQLLGNLVHVRGGDCYKMQRSTYSTRRQD